MTAKVIKAVNGVYAHVTYGSFHFGLRGLSEGCRGSLKPSFLSFDCAVSCHSLSLFQMVQCHSICETEQAGKYDTLFAMPLA